MRRIRCILVAVRSPRPDRLPIPPSRCWITCRAICWSSSRAAFAEGCRGAHYVSLPSAAVFDWPDTGTSRRSRHRAGSRSCGPGGPRGQVLCRDRLPGKLV